MLESSADKRNQSYVCNWWGGGRFAREGERCRSRTWYTLGGEPKVYLVR